MTRQLISTNRQPLLRSPHAQRPPRGRLRSSRLVGGDLLLLCLRANRNLFRARSRILESYNDRGICCVGAGFPNRRRVEQFSQMISHSQKPTFSEQPDIGRKMNRSISLLRLVGFLCKWLGSTKIWEIGRAHV